MTTDTDHTADGCPYSWCTAHHGAGECTCPYAASSPHRAEHCRYPTDHTGDD